jgi:uncharacterized protein GlcG (DUF336 family)
MSNLYGAPISIENAKKAAAAALAEARRNGWTMAVAITDTAGFLVGAIGVSGGTSAQDNQCATPGADALK